MKLQPLHISAITEMHELGKGSGTLDLHGRVEIGPTRRLVPGDAVLWLRLVAAGLVSGEGDVLLLTEAGRALAEKSIAGRTREARG